MRFTGDVRAVPEGTVVFPDEPLLEITAPISEAQLVETAVMNACHFQTVPEAVRRLNDPGPYPVTHSDRVLDLQRSLKAEIEALEVRRPI